MPSQNHDLEHSYSGIHPETRQIISRVRELIEYYAKYIRHIQVQTVRADSPSIRGGPLGVLTVRHSNNLFYTHRTCALIRSKSCTSVLQLGKRYATWTFSAVLYHYFTKETRLSVTQCSVYRYIASRDLVEVRGCTPLGTYNCIC